MDFGKVTPEELNAVDFSIPPDCAENDMILSGNPADTRFYIGCAKWGRKEWVGNLYPPKTKEADFLSLYARFFNSVELNATFYKLPSKKQTAEWRSKVGEDFLFCPKVSQSISHIRRLSNTGELTERFLDGISGFGKNLGPVLLMLHPQMGPKRIETVHAFLKDFPKDTTLFVEFRHEDWYTNQNTFNEVIQMLAENKAGMVITDAAGRRDCMHMCFTLPQAFIRFQGNNLHPTDYTRIDAWAERIKSWKEKGMEKVFFFAHQPDETHSPVSCQYLKEKLGV